MSKRKQRILIALQPDINLPGIHGPNHASLLSKSNLKHELSSYSEACLIQTRNNKTHNSQ